ncbi:hypothetical protein K2X33_00685 [bacterium]|nr:hypothetical protein [bacterium]
MAVSLAGHALFLLQYQTSVAPTEELKWVELEPKTEETSRSRKSSAGKLSLRNLLKLPPSAKSPGPGQVGETEGAPLQFGESMQLAREMPFETEMEYDRWMEALFQRLDQAIEYPECFVRTAVQGTISFMLKLDGDGRIKSLTRPEGDRRLLAVSLAAAHHALSQPLPERLRRSKGLALGISIRYVSTPDPEERFHEPQTRHRNQFSFIRVGLRETALEHLVNHVLPPVFITPGGLVVNILSAAQMVDNWRHGRASEIQWTEISHLYFVNNERRPRFGTGRR